MPLIVKLPNPRHRAQQEAEGSSEAPASGSHIQLSSDPNSQANSITSDLQTDLAAAGSATPGVHDSVMSRPVAPTQSELSERELDALNALQSMSIAGPSGSNSPGVQATPTATSAATEQSESLASPQRSLAPAEAPLLDVIVAPAVLAHRYVRGRNVSLIVERPERVRAVLLGAAAVLGRIAAGELSETTRRGKSDPNPPSATHQQAASDDADDLIAQLAGMSMSKPGESSSGAVDSVTQDSEWSPMQVLHSTKSVSLTQHPAMRAVHAEDDDLLDALLPDIEKRRRAKAIKHQQRDPNRENVDVKAPTSDIVASQTLADYIDQLCLYAPHDPPAPRAPPARTARGLNAPFTPTLEGRTRSSARSGANTPVVASPAPRKDRQPPMPAPSTGGSAAPAEPHNLKTELGSDAPPLTAPDLAASARPQIKLEDPVTPQKEFQENPLSTQVSNAIPNVRPDNEGSVNSSSSDEEGEETHHSEVPSHLSQGDLYLRGVAGNANDDDVSQYGSREAIEHAVGAALEAVDRVVRAARVSDEPTSASSSQTVRSNPHGSTSTSGGQGFITPVALASSTQGPASLPTSDALSARRAFVLTRPPGHHCSSSQPSGFCWVNNVAIAAQHAYQAHGIDRVCIFDIDLHHGNGTQKIAWKINEDARRLDAERDAKLSALRKQAQLAASPAKQRGGSSSRAGARRFDFDAEAAKLPPRALQVYYSSLHDIESYPCEDSDPDLVRDASVVLQGAHGQWITNVHLESYDSPEAFGKLYEDRYAPALLGGARRFLQQTDADPSRTLFFISCGFDACSYELPGMQRHNKHVPPGFYGKVADDIVALAEQTAHGKVVSLLEGGYGDRALCSGTIAHLLGLMGRSASRPWRKEAKLEQQASSASGLFNSVIASRPQSAAASTGALDPFASSWFSLESLKALEKTLATATANAITQLQSGFSASAKRGLTAASNSFVGTPTSSRSSKAGGTVGASAAEQPAWIKEAAVAFAAFDELCAPLMKGFWPTAKSVSQRKR